MSSSKDIGGSHETRDGQEYAVLEQQAQNSEPAAKKRARKEPVALQREAGRSLLPFSRVQKIIKADKDMPIVAKDATFLISLATEEFIKRLCEAGKRVAEREKRATVQHKDIATVVRKIDEFLFLEEIIPWIGSDPPGRRKPQGKGSSNITATTTLDQFVGAKSIENDDDGMVDDSDIVMNDDGTMVVGGEAEGLDEDLLEDLYQDELS